MLAQELHSLSVITEILVNVCV